MTDAKLEKIVDESVALDREIAEKETRLAELKETLKHEADTRPDEHAATELGGWSWTAHGSDGNIARVTVEGDKLKSSISSEKDVDKAKDIAGSMFSRLFEPKVTYKLIKGFREIAEDLLGTTSKKLIKHVTSDGTSKVSFETKEKN